MSLFPIFQKRPPVIVGVDIGTSTIKVAVGERRSDGGLSMVGSHSAESRGLRKGEVVHHEEASLAIIEAITQAEDALNIEIGEVELALTGGHLEASNHRGTLALDRDDPQVTAADIEEVLDNARACVRLAEDRAVLHVIRQKFFLDGGDGVLDPLGQVASRMEADAHCIHGIKTRFENLLNCLHARPQTAFEVCNMVFSGLASALAVLDPHDKQCGAIVLDIGAGTTEYLVYSNSIIRQSGVIAVGGDHLVNDLQTGLKLQGRRRAEAIIREHGSVWLDESVGDQKVMVQTSELIQDRQKSFYLGHIHAIMHHRMDELLRIIHKRIEAMGMEDLVNATVFLTGGCSRLRGLAELSTSIFGLESRRATPRGFDGQIEHLAEPEMSTAVGLVKYRHIKEAESPAEGHGLGNLFRKILGMES